MYKVIGLILVLLITCLFFDTSVYAQSGCCSWHGGVCGFSCCDGTPLSLRCGGGGYYTPPVYYYTPQAPQMNAQFSYIPNDDGKTYTILMTWNQVDNTGFSIALHKYPGGDPGPLVDTYGYGIQFNNVLPGTYYADMKVAINGVWSNITYWKVNVPQWVAPTPVPTPIFTESPMNYTTQGTSGEDDSWLLWVSVGLISGGIYIAKKLFK